MCIYFFLLSRPLPSLSLSLSLAPWLNALHSLLVLFRYECMMNNPQMNRKNIYHMRQYNSLSALVLIANSTGKMACYSVYFDHNWHLYGTISTKSIMRLGVSLALFLSAWLSYTSCYVFTELCLAVCKFVGILVVVYASSLSCLDLYELQVQLL